MKHIDYVLSILLLSSSLFLTIIIIYNRINSPIDYDEAYNLQIVDSLVKGKGYASFGSFRGNGPWLFDPYITTGPIVLLPLSIIWKISNGSLIVSHIFMEL